MRGKRASSRRDYHDGVETRRFEALHAEFEILWKNLVRQTQPAVPETPVITLDQTPSPEVITLDKTPPAPRRTIRPPASQYGQL